MSGLLSAEERAEYTRVIDEILHDSDLQTVTRKAIMRGLEEVVSKDLEDQKKAIKELITARFDAISAETVPSAPSPPADVKDEANGHTPSDQSEDDADASPDSDVFGNGEIQVATQPAIKKQKRESSTDADARLAAELQAQEEALARGRTTRGAGTTKGPKKANAKTKTKTKTPKKKSAKRARDDSDGDLTGAESGEKPKRKAGGGFQKPFNLSYPLMELCGVEQLSRPQVVKKLWEHIKANDLQDPTDKRRILCDEKMGAIFKLDKVDMFQMNKLIGNHLYPVEAE
ncbi:SWIB-domain-containing protein [Coniochaeta ligniaria NRRL 30616]|uniref:SWIB-domain-containing protein n=1 Tax=Coniochaeta ligniaria NRRL 30616 TaxID=1408157 RepID=A0A1J7I4T8_9PEZI|nr:SWIB-domain-containing protein [Coniochaeta ligniaria NRRL 30616]